MKPDFDHMVCIPLDHDNTLYKLMLWCGRHIAPNYDLWQCNLGMGWDYTMNEVVFQFVHAHHACEFALTWS
jgi:hypothetical protein